MFFLIALLSSLIHAFFLFTLNKVILFSIITILLIFCWYNLSTIFNFIPFYYFGILLIVFLLFIIVVGNFYISFAKTCAFLSILWLLAIFFTFSNTFILLFFSIIIELFMLYLGNFNVIYLFCLLITVFYAYPFFKGDERKKIKAKYKVLFIFSLLLFLAPFVKNISFSHNKITWLYYLFFASFAIFPIRKDFYFLIKIFFLIGLFILWDDNLFSYPFFWILPFMIVSLIKYDIFSPEKSRFFHHFKKVCVSTLMLFAFYFYSGYVLNKIFLNYIFITPSNLKKYFKISQILSYFDEDNYKFWIKKTAMLSNSLNNPDLKQLTLSYSKKLLHLEPSFNNYLFCIKIIRGLEYYKKSYKLYLKIVPEIFKNKKVLKDFIYFLSTHRELKDSYKYYRICIYEGIRRFPEDNEFYYLYKNLKKGGTE